MLVEPVKINNLSYDNPYFIAKAEKVQDDGEEKKPWIKRNATALSCIAAVGIATAAILIAKGRARKFAIAGGKESYDFNQKLLKSKNLEDMLPDIDKMLSHNDDEVKFDTVRTLIDGKYINEDIAEKIISTLASLKPLKIWSQGSVDFHVHEVIKVMEDKNLLTPKFLDKLLDNAANYSPEYKMLIADNLAGIDRYKENPKIVGNQFKKLVNLLDNIEEKEYKGRFSNIGKPSMLQIDILSNHYKYTKLDTHKIKEIKEILNSNKYADDIKLNFIDAVSFSRTADNESVTAAELYKELFLGLQNNSAFKASKAFLHENKLDIADWLMLKMSLNPNKVLKPEEKLPVIQSLKKSALEEIKMNRFEYKDAYKFDKLLTEELKTKREVFADANPKYASIDDLEK
ncbi:MAG: hypothetical protein LBJ74_03175, partial [Heliobacteriaceae bacterium]|nr:hypothetical protein [Heliobacteriaceae bacterium]